MSLKQCHSCFQSALNLSITCLAENRVKMKGADYLTALAPNNVKVFETDSENLLPSQCLDFF